MEALIASRNNPVLIRWLRFIQVQIAERNYNTRSAVWARRKMRYIHSTTGPLCFQRFLRMKENQDVLRTLKFISSNNFSHTTELCSKEKRNFEVLSFESNSYYSQREPFKVPVGDGEGPLPVLDDSQPSVRYHRRFKRKRKPVQKDVRPQRDPSLQELELSPEKRDALGGDVRDGSQPSNTHLTSAPGEVKHRSWPAEMLVSAPPPTKKQRVDQESQTDNDAVYANVDRLRQRIQQSGNCQATKVLLQDCPLDLATFLATPTHLASLFFVDRRHD